VADRPIVLADELAVHRTLAAYCQHLDDGDFSGLAHQFSENGSFTFGQAHASGRAMLESWFAERNPPERRDKHLTMNVIVDVEGDRAVASSDFLFVRMVDGTLTPLYAGRYRDELVRGDGRWMIRTRVVTPLT
jgi:3-phenylpropionate/cinnamic acid dioxygenase small subunit